LKLLDLTQLLLFCSNIYNFTENVIKLFSWPKFDEGCWNFRMIPVRSRAVFILPLGSNRNGKTISDYFAVLTIILPLI